MIYLIGALKNQKIPELAKELRDRGHDVFDDWFAPGPHTDEYWQEYEKKRGRGFVEALNGAHATDVFEFDKRNLEKADTVILVAPCGKSGHLELGWALGRGKIGYVLLDGEPERYDVMYRFATKVFTTKEELFEELTNYDVIGSKNLYNDWKNNKRLS